MAAPEIAKQHSQQIVETEHLLKALLEQPNGMAQRVVTKADANPTALLDATEAFIQKQPRVTGDSSQAPRARPLPPPPPLPFETLLHQPQCRLVAPRYLRMQQ